MIDLGRLSPAELAIASELDRHPELTGPDYQELAELDALDRAVAAARIAGVHQE